ncbi:MAG: lactonase family protein, partial [Saprospiraceae bacterium]|nr:lactonase family protein [Saprospiraceae bacterium]
CRVSPGAASKLTISVLPNQKGPRAHCVKFDPNGKFLYTVDLGIDQIITYPVSASGVGEATSRFALDPGDGPRHFIFDPTRDLAYVVNELGSSVVSMRIDHNTGELTRIDKKGTLPEGFEGDNYCADIHISSDGKFLYASNRGHNSLAIFSVGDQGELEKIGVESVQGEWPRNFTLSPDEKYVLVANQNTDNITVFNRNTETGALTFTGNQYQLSKPVALKFFD